MQVVTRVICPMLFSTSATAPYSCTVAVSAWSFGSERLARCIWRDRVFNTPVCFTHVVPRLCKTHFAGVIYTLERLVVCSTPW